MSFYKKSRTGNYKKSSLTDEQNAFYIARKRMVEEQIRPEVKDERVLDAFAKVPRHLFVDEGMIDQAYKDHPLYIGEGQTISQPLIVAMMTELLELKGGEKVLEIGTGSGYQTAILCELAKHVYTIERIAKLANRARKVLYDLGYINFTLNVGDGTLGWKEHAPYDGIIVTAGAPLAPAPIIEQLADGGRLVIPIGGEFEQVLTVIRRVEDKIIEKPISGCRFVKLVGEYGWKEN